MTFTKINKVVPKIIKSHNLSQAMEAAYICRIAEQTASKEFVPIIFKNGILTIVAKDHIRAQELQLNCQNIITKINRALGKDIVKKLRFRT